MARIEVEPSSTPQPESEGIVPQITGEGGHMQQLLDQAISMQNAGTIKQDYGAQKRSGSKPTPQPNEEETDDVAKKLSEFFNIQNSYHSIFLKDDETGETWEFVVKTLESSHFIVGSLKILDPAKLKEDETGYMTMFKEMFQYFIRSLVEIKKGGDVLTPEFITRGIPKYNPNYYDILGRELTNYLNLGQITTVVLEYTAFFNKVQVPQVEKKIP